MSAADEPRRAELWDAARAAEVDRHSIEVVGMPSPILMERAALVCSHEVAALRGGTALPVVVVCGPGNNGGDGVAVARQLHGWGVPVQVVRASARANASCEQQWALARACGVLELSIDAMPAAALVVDALLGTGSRGAPRGEIAAALARIAAVEGPRLAIDVPSGVDPDHGGVADDAVVAAVTVTFGRSKPGLHVTPGRAHAGVVVVADIGLVATDEHGPSAWLLDPPACAEALAALPVPRHKGERGHVGIVGGSAHTPGAVLLAASAAFRGGAGLCTVIGDDAALRAAVVAARPEVMLADRDALAQLGADALVVGPGLTDPRDHAGLEALWRDDPRPAVWDASALDHVPPDAPTAAQRVITPHPGEAARMLARFDPSGAAGGAPVQAQRLLAARVLAARTGATVVLKGEGTVIASAEHTTIDTVGDAALATAGSGDVLAGLVGALLARGIAADRAATIAVALHGAAGRVVSGHTAGSRAGDLLDALDEGRRWLATAAAAMTLPRWRLG